MSLDSYLQALVDGHFVEGLVVLFALLIGHSLADHPLQGEYLALYKNRHNAPEPHLARQPTLWPHCLTVHSLIHAGAVWIVTTSPLLGLIEFILHWIIDFAKAERWTNFHVDQLLHVVCKIGYVIAIGQGWVSLPGL